MPMIGRRAALAAAAGGLVAKPRRDAAWLSLPPTPALPHPARSGMVDHDGCRLYVAEYGTGPPTVLLHGGLANTAYWGNQIPALAATRTVFVVDLRGHGRSTLSDAALTYEAMAGDVLAIMDQRGVARADLCGWSDGGIVALHLALRVPARVSGVFTFGANVTQAGLRPGGDRTPVFAEYLSRTRVEYAALSPTPGGYERLRAAMSGLWARGTGMTLNGLAAIAAPSRIADGAHDEIITARETAAIARAIPRASLRMLARASHFGLLQTPEDVLDAMQLA